MFHWGLLAVHALPSPAQTKHLEISVRGVPITVTKISILLSDTQCGAASKPGLVHSCHANGIAKEVRLDQIKSKFLPWRA